MQVARNKISSYLILITEVCKSSKQISIESINHENLELLDYFLALVVGSKPIDTSECFESAVQYSGANDRAYNDVSYQRVCHGHVSLRQENSCSRHT